ncbi:hypothetical protein GFS24_28060 [Chitinophaga sp. SYP-B3965]|uniref:hypothetical protein n=1 Tax=Chitinophaga sp. SYP-B3965 TaxID=2663120 RepID=UPI001299A321|nr:hypothetical protein [Chitinophaga sp. SYP-B3965]MRG48996.1 hypothetical protein [Chitinophaga sp. SYP-B3965]
MSATITLDLGILLEVTSKCKQDYENWTFFNVRDANRSVHFDTIANDYFRLLLVDMNSMLSLSRNIKITFWQVFDRLEAGKYGENKISIADIIRWREVLLASYKTIEKIKLLRDKKVYYVNNEQTCEIFISRKEIEEVLLKMEHIVLEICYILEYPITSIPTVEERSNHTIADAFRQM